MSLTALRGGAVHLCTHEVVKPSPTIGFMLFMDCIDLHLLSFESKIKKRCTFGNSVDSLEKRKHLPVHIYGCTCMKGHVTCVFGCVV